MNATSITKLTIDGMRDVQPAAEALLIDRQRGTVDLPCGTFRVASSDAHGMDLLRPRGGKVNLTYSPRCTVNGHPDAIAFSVWTMGRHAASSRNLGDYAVLPDATVIRLDR